MVNLFCLKDFRDSHGLRRMDCKTKWYSNKPKNNFLTHEIIFAFILKPSENLSTSKTETAQLDEYYARWMPHCLRECVCFTARIFKTTFSVIFLRDNEDCFHSRNGPFSIFVFGEWYKFGNWKLHSLMKTRGSF